MTHVADQWSDLEETALLFASLFRHTQKTLTTARKKAGINERPNAYHYRILGLLAREGPLPVTEIGIRLDIAKSNVSACVNKQASLGNLERIPGKLDRRVVMIGITEKGRIEAEEAYQAMTQVMARYFSRLTPKDQNTFKRSVTAIGEILGKLYS
jgi:DNA-binding MarR family transcriptional regulator